MLANLIVELSYVSKGSLFDHLWILETNGSSKAIGGGAGMVLQSPKGLLVTQVVKFPFLILNNKDEYEAMLLGLQVAQAL